MFSPLRFTVRESALLYTPAAVSDVGRAATIRHPLPFSAPRVEEVK